MSLSPYRIDLSKYKLNKMTISETPQTKTTLNVKNFGKRNTPDWAKTAGDWALRIGVFGAGIIGINTMLPKEALEVIPVAVVATIVKVGWYGVLIGLLGKALSSSFGIVQKEKE